jgi:prepilin-type processing-associated H-X9-DG protein
MFAPGVINPGSNYGTQRTQTFVRNIPGFLLLLPYLDQSALYNNINFEAATGINDWSSLGGGGSQTPPWDYISVFRCPSDREYDDPRTYTSATGPPSAYECVLAYRSSYGFVSQWAYTETSTRRNYANNDNVTKSATGINGSAIIRDIRDGTSNTFLMAESVFQKSSAAYGPFWNEWTLHDPIVPRYGINPSVSSSLLRPQAYRMSSRHPGGAHALMADGAVRFINENIQGSPSTNWPAASVLGSLTSIQAGEVLDPF